MKTACIIVTYNRCNLLANCLKAIANQTVQPDKIFIVDNASTDDTEKIIREFDSKIETQYIKLKENIGGAGGFYTGLRAAHSDINNKFERFWLMDDDGLPKDDCLEKLLIHSDEDYIAPVVLDIEKPEQVAFPYLEQNLYIDILEKYGKQGIIQNYSNPFNGILLSRDLIDKIGYPKKEMFIWGDEIEFRTRAEYYGFNHKTAVDAIHYHPRDRMQFQKDFLGNKTLVYVDSKLRLYCKYRNSAYTLKKYKSVSKNIYFYLAYIYFYLITRKFDIKGLSFFLNSTKDGRKEDFSKHTKFIPHK